MCTSSNKYDLIANHKRMYDYNEINRGRCILNTKNFSMTIPSSSVFVWHSLNLSSYPCALVPLLISTVVCKFESVFLFCPFAIRYFGIFMCRDFPMSAKIHQHPGHTMIRDMRWKSVTGKWDVVLYIRDRKSRKFTFLQHLGKPLKVGKFSPEMTKVKKIKGQECLVPSWSSIEWSLFFKVKFRIISAVYRRSCKSIFLVVKRSYFISWWWKRQGNLNYSCFLYDRSIKKAIKDIPTRFYWFFMFYRCFRHFLLKSTRKKQHKKTLTSG